MERLRLLEAIPGWRGNPEEHWQQSFEQLRRWVLDAGRIPSRSADDPVEARLARWADTQRRLKRAWARNGYGSRASRAITAERERLLETIPRWRWSPRQQTWRESYDELTRWVAERGRLPSASTDDPDERHLAHWVSFQRELRRRRDENGAEPMRRDCRQLLEAIPGWRWLLPRRGRIAGWRASYDELRCWVAARGRFPSPSGGDRVERRLARWSAYQRQEKRRRDRDGTGPMTVERQALLERIDGWEWSPRSGPRG